MDIGAKWSVISRVLSHRLTVNFSDIFRHPPNDDARAREAYTGAYRIFASTIGTPRQAYNAAMNHFFAPINATYGDLLAPYRIDDRLWRLDIDVHYFPVRPRQHPYDAEYYQKNLAQYRDRNSVSCVEKHDPFEGIVQDFERGFVNPCDSLFYIMFDVHYYLAEWRPQIPGRYCLVGGTFHPLPGSYSLPLGEGSYDVWDNQGQAYVTMWTKSAGMSYDHPLVSVQNANSRIHYGWYSHVSASGPTDTLSLTPVRFPALRIRDCLTGKSVQSSWIVKNLQQLALNAPEVKAIPEHRQQFERTQVDLDLLTQYVRRSNRREGLFTLDRSEPISFGKYFECKLWYGFGYYKLFEVCVRKETVETNHHREREYFIEDDMRPPEVEHVFDENERQIMRYGG